MSDPKPASQASENRTTPNRKLVVTAILLAMFMAAMEATVVATAMPTVVADLSGLELYGWVGSIYMLATTVSIPLWGKLADLQGRRSIMLAGLAVFLAGSIASGMAPTMKWLIVFRAIQGLGAGGLQPIAMTIIGDIFTVEERAKMQGVFGAVWGVAGMAGPLLGGLIVKALSWRYVFYVNVPPGLLSAALLVTFFKEEPRGAGKKTSIDVAGAMILVATVLAILGAAGGTQPFVLGPAAAVGVVLFVIVEKRAKEPILPLHLFANRVVAVGSAVAACVGAVMMATIMYLPLFVQAVRGGSPTEAGTAVAPMLIGWPLASALSARLIVKLGFRPLVRAGLLGIFVSTTALAFAVKYDASLNIFRVTMFVLGAGMGLVMVALIIAIQDSVEWRERGVATSSSMFFRMIGGAVIVGALGAVVARSVSGKIPQSDLAKMLGPERTLGITHEKLVSYAGALDEAMGPLFFIIAGGALIAFVVGLAFPDVHVKKRGGPVTGRKPEEKPAVEAPAEA